MGQEVDRVPAKPLDHLGLSGPSDVPCVAVRWQIAQKLHACTEALTAERRNDRFRDLIDILLLWDLVELATGPGARGVRTGLRVARDAPVATAGRGPRRLGPPL